MDENKPQTVASMATDIVSAYVANFQIPHADVAGFYLSVAAAVGQVEGGNYTAASTQAAPEEKLIPAVSIKKSVTPDFIISLEDGKPYKSLKRHLSTKGMTPEEYRAKWGLPRDYPMTAPNYSKQRSELAKQMGLGKGGAGAVAPAPAAKGRADLRQAAGGKAGSRKREHASA